MAMGSHSDDFGVTLGGLIKVDFDDVSLELSIFAVKDAFLNKHSQFLVCWLMLRWKWGHARIIMEWHGRV